MMNWVYVAFLLLATGCTSTPKENYSKGRLYLDEVASLENSSRQKMLEANKLRKKVSSLHVKKRKTSDSAAKTEIDKMIKEHKDKMDSLREEGADHRADATETQKDAVKKLERGLKGKFKDWIQTDIPFARIGNTASRGHNTRVRSTSRGDLLVGKPGEEQNAPEDLNLSTFRLSRERKMIAHVEVHTDTGNPAGIPLNEIHQWRLIVSDLEGNPVDTKFKVLGHMPGHVHGLPTQPQVTKQLAPGVYLVEGMKFQMQGWWVIEFDNSTDRLRFDFAI